MRPNNNNRRGRGRGPRKPHGGPHNHGGGGGMPSKGQTYDSSGPDIRVRGNAYQVLEKYLQLARDAGTAGDRIAAENFLQHADHYYRVVAALSEGQRPRIGGREVSVADVNVHNVNQGLSAAMSGHGHSGSGGDEPSGEGQQGGAGNGQARPAQQHQHPQGGESEQRASPAPEADRGGAPSNSESNANDRDGNVDDGTRFGPTDEQPDYPEELLSAVSQPAPRDAPAEGQDGASQGRMGRGRRRGPGRRVRSEGDEAPVPTPPNPDGGQ